MTDENISCEPYHYFQPRNWGIRLESKVYTARSRCRIRSALHGRRGAVVIYRNLPGILAAGRARTEGISEPPADYDDERVRLALEIDRVMREQAPAGWRGDQAREAQVLSALFPLLDRNREATRALFELIKNQPDY